MSMKNTLMEHQANIPLTGVSFCPQGVEKLAEGKQVKITPEPSNPHDPNALRVSLLNGEPVGYIPAPLAKRLAEENTHDAYIGRVARLRTYQGKTVGAEVVLEMTIPAGSRLAR